MFRTKRKLTPFLLLLIAAGIISCNNAEEKKAGGPGFGPGGFGANQPPKDFKVFTLKPRTARINEGFPATLQGQQVIEIRPKIDGYIDAIYVNEGAMVKKGQLLFRISNPQYEQAELTANAAIKSAEADVDAAKMQAEKVKPLVEKDIVSKYELESAEYTLRAKEAALAQAKVALSNAQTNVGYTILRAPADGVIGLIPYKVGALVNSSNPSPLTMLSNIDHILAYYSLNEKQLLRFFSTIPGKTTAEKISNLEPASLALADGSIYPEKGKIEIASGLISTETGSITFKAVFANPLGILRSGASAIVRVPRNIDTALVVPQAATFELQDKRLVYVVNKNNEVTSTSITAAPSDNGQYFIVTGGLNAGDQVVIEGLVGLRDKMKIIPKETPQDSVYAKFQ